VNPKLSSIHSQKYKYVRELSLIMHELPGAAITTRRIELTQAKRTTREVRLLTKVEPL